MNWYRAIHSAGVKNAGNVVRPSDFHPADALTGPAYAATPPAQLLRFPLSRPFPHAASLPPETVTAWRSPVEQSAGDFSSTRQVVQCRTHPGPTEHIAVGEPEKTTTAPAAGLNSRSRSPSSTASVTSEPSHPWPTARVVDVNGEPSCLEKSGHPLARSAVFHSDATAKVRADASRYLGSVVGSAPGCRFFSEAEAEQLALGPRLPHHRRAMTADEALAGIITALVCGAALIYLIARAL